MKPSVLEPKLITQPIQRQVKLKERLIRSIPSTLVARSLALARYAEFCQKHDVPLLPFDKVLVYKFLLSHAPTAATLWTAIRFAIHMLGCAHSEDLVHSKRICGLVERKMVDRPPRSQEPPIPVTAIARLETVATKGSSAYEPTSGWRRGRSFLPSWPGLDGATSIAPSTSFWTSTPRLPAVMDPIMSSFRPGTSRPVPRPSASCCYCPWWLLSFPFQGSHGLKAG